MTHLGIDLSAYQGDVDGAALAAQGLEFAYVKASEGGSYKNPDAVQQVGALKAAGIKVGLYHFVNMDDLYDQQMNFYLMAKALGGSELPPALDVETPDPGGWQALSKMVANFAISVEGWTNALTNPRSILYVNQEFYNALPGFPYGRWVWLADPGAAQPAKPCLVWQNGERPLRGALGQVDADQFTGTDADWALFTGEPATSPSEPPVSPPKPPQPLPPIPGVDVPLSQPLNYRPGQYDVFQIALGALFHYFYTAGAWHEENLGEVSGQGALAPHLQGTPSAAVIGGVCVVIVEDTNAAVWSYQQGATGPWEATKA